MSEDAPKIPKEDRDFQNLLKESQAALEEAPPADVPELENFGNEED